MDRTANLLGALAQLLTDRLDAAARVAGPTSRSSAAALSALHQWLGPATIDHLGRVVGLTSSGTVRLVDRLEAEGLVRRTSGDDARSTVVALTESGDRVGARVGAARADVLDAALAGIDADAREALEGLLDRLLTGLVDDPVPTDIDHVCRLCDPDACGHTEGRCPVTEAGRRAAARDG